MGKCMHYACARLSLHFHFDEIWLKHVEHEYYEIA